MSNTLPIASIKLMPQNSVVQGISGTVKSMSPIRSNQRGQIQNVTIMDGGGDSIDATLWQHPAIGTINPGDSISITPGQGNDVKMGKPYNNNPQLSVSNTANISLEAGSEPVPGQVNAAAQSSRQPANNASPAASGGGGKEMNLKQMAKAFAVSAKFAYDEAKELFPDPNHENHCQEIAKSAPENVALWWFGQKWPSMPKKPLVEVLAKSANVPVDFAKNFIQTYCMEEYNVADLPESQLTDNDKTILLSAQYVKMLSGQYEASKNPPASLQEQPQPKQTQEEDFGDAF
jgi:hypothetical protein